MTNLTKLRRITDLFEEGEALNLGTDASPEWAYVRKPNGFEHEEAVQDGRAARALFLEMHAPGSKGRVAADSTASGMDNDELVMAVIQGQGTDLFMQARDEVRSSPDWQERLVMLDRAEVLNQDAGPEEREAVEKVQTDFYTELVGEQEKLIGSLRRELEAEVKKDRPAVEQRWVDAYIKNSANGEFITARGQTEVYFALRDVEMELDEGKWVVKKVGDRILENRGQVRELPDGLLRLVVEALDKLQMAPEEAGNSDAPTDSSSPSEQPSKPEDSRRSTPKATSARRAGTSSTRSTRR